MYWEQRNGGYYMNCVEVKNKLYNNELDQELCSIYGDEKLLTYQKN